METYYDNQINSITAKEMLYGMAQICKGMTEGPFDVTVDGVFAGLKDCVKTDTGTHAIDYLSENYDIVAGLFRLMAASLDAITGSITNEDLRIIDKARAQAKTTA